MWKEQPIKYFSLHLWRLHHVVNATEYPITLETLNSGDAVVSLNMTEQGLRISGNYEYWSEVLGNDGDHEDVIICSCTSQPPKTKSVKNILNL